MRVKYTMACTWRSENYFQALVLCVHPMDDKNQTQVIRIGSKYTNLLNPLISPIKCF